MQRQPIAQVAHDVVAVSPEADDDGRGPVYQDPYRHWRLFGQLSRVPDQIDSRQRPEGIGDVIRTVRERCRGRGENLEKRVEVLGLVVKMLGPGMHRSKVASEEAGAGSATRLLRDHVPIDATKDVVFDFDEEISRAVPWSGRGVG